MKCEIPRFVPPLRGAARLVGCILLAQCFSAGAQAALGGDVSSVESDRVHLQAQVRSSVAPAGYTVHEITTPMHSTVREYVSDAGKVFAVSWRGSLLPDLQQLLGSYYQAYQAAASAPHLGHRHLQVTAPEVVIRSGGHLRAFYGYAYVPSLLPTNLSPDDIK